MSEEQRRWPRPEEYDPGRLLTYCALVYVGILLLFVSVIIGYQIWKSGEANTESWAALTGLIGWATSQVSIIFSNRFGNTQQSAKKDEVIARQVNAAANLAASVSGTGPGTPGAVTPAPMNLDTGVIPAKEVQSEETKT